MKNFLHRTSKLKRKQVLFLQTDCISCIIEHLDKYSTEHLSLLPTRIRRQLLTCLPPLDILKLEGTSVVSDLDMNEVWHVIAEHYDEAKSTRVLKNIYNIYIGLVDANFYKTIKDDWRSLFCTRTLFVMLDTLNTLSALSLPKVTRPYCKDYCFDILCRLIALPPRSELALSFPALVVPKRHVVYADSSEHTLLELFTVLLKESNFRPKVMTISCGFLDYSEFYQCLLCEESNKSQSLTYSLFADMISEVECLEFFWRYMPGYGVHVENGYKEASHHTITSILGAIFKNPSPKLSSLCVRVQNFSGSYCLTLHDCLSSIAPFFSAHHYTEASKNGVLPISTAYAGLKNVHIFAVRMDCPQDITPIFHHQSGLEGIEVHFASCFNPDLLLATIQDVVSQCQLQFCVFDCAGHWWNNKLSFESTFQQFLKSSHDAEVHASVNNDAVIIPACSSLESVPERKRFMINFFMCNEPCSGSIFSWLRNAGVTRPLKLVKSNDFIINGSHKDAFMYCLSTSQALEWSEWTEDESVLASMNKCSNLQVVTLKKIQPAVLLDLLPVVFANSPQLKELSLSEAFSNRDQLEKAFECLMSCPYPEQLTVDLRDNESLTQEDIEKLLQVWRKMGQGRKLKAILLGCDLQPIVAEMVLQN